MNTDIQTPLRLLGCAIGSSGGPGMGGGPSIQTPTPQSPGLSLSMPGMQPMDLFGRPGGDGAPMDTAGGMSQGQGRGNASIIQAILALL